MLILAALAPSFSAGAARPPCTPAAAKAAIAESKPRLALIGERELIPPSMAEAPLCFDATGDGRADMAVALFSGGTAGDVGWLFFVAGRSHWRLAGWGSGYKLGVFRAGSSLHTVQPLCRPNDPNCCPTGGFDHALWRWNGARLVAAQHWHTKRFRR